jgi:hypothetical protein
MTKTNLILQFVQRAFWLYIAEAVIVLAIVMMINRLHS